MNKTIKNMMYPKMKMKLTKIRVPDLHFLNINWINLKIIKFQAHLSYLINEDNLSKKINLLNIPKMKST